MLWRKDPHFEIIANLSAKCGQTANLNYREPSDNKVLATGKVGGWVEREPTDLNDKQTKPKGDKWWLDKSQRSKKKLIWWQTLTDRKNSITKIKENSRLKLNKTEGGPTLKLAFAPAIWRPLRIHRHFYSADHIQRRQSNTKWWVVLEDEKLCILTKQNETNLPKFRCSTAMHLNYPQNHPKIDLINQQQYFRKPFFSKI